LVGWMSLFGRRCRQQSRLLLRAAPPSWPHVHARPRTTPAPTRPFTYPQTHACLPPKTHGMQARFTARTPTTLQPTRPRVPATRSMLRCWPTSRAGARVRSGAAADRGWVAGMFVGHTGRHETPRWLSSRRMCHLAPLWVWVTPRRGCGGLPCPARPERCTLGPAWPHPVPDPLWCPPLPTTHHPTPVLCCSRVGAGVGGDGHLGHLPAGHAQGLRLAARQAAAGAQHGWRGLPCGCGGGAAESLLRARVCGFNVVD
jgi:hypothetical protein